MKDLRYYAAKRFVLRNRLAHIKNCLGRRLNMQELSPESDLNMNIDDSKLVMTMVCRDEIDLIEQNIRFHLAMGVDGIIVIDHRSTDGTRELLGELKQQGLLLKVIHKDCEAHLHSAFVLEMIDLAINKYSADWIINADADEFYFAESLSLKSEILKSSSKANVLKVYSQFFFSDGREDFWSCPFFCKYGLTDPEYTTLGIEKNFMTEYWGAEPCPKSIHSTRDFISITDGNHAVKMINPSIYEPPSISLYHYKIRNFKSLERKALKAASTLSALRNNNMSRGWRVIVELYGKGELRHYYDTVFGDSIFKILSEAGYVCEDSSVYDFMKSRGIIKLD